MNNLDELNDFNDVLASLGPEAVERIVSAAVPHSSENNSVKMRVSDWKWFDELSLEDQISWVIKNVFATGSLGLIYGAPGTGKSFLAVDLAMSIALGVEWCGLKVSPGGVLYVALEGGRGLTARFLANATKYAGFLGHQIPLAVWSGSVDLCANPDDTHSLIERVQQNFAKLPAVIVIDTLARAIGAGDENSSRDMNAVISNCARIQQETGAHVVLVHHAGKDATRGPRGHSALLAAVDTAIEVGRSEDTGVSTAKVVKQKDGAAGAVYRFKLVPIEIGKDEDGEPIPTCYVEYVDLVEAKPKKSLSAREKRGLELLEQTLIDFGKLAPPGHAHIPDDATVVDIAAWREACRKGGLSDSDKSNTQIQAFNRMKLGLHGKAVIGECDCKVWICRWWRDSVTERDASMTCHTAESVTDMTPPLKGCHDVTSLNGESYLPLIGSDFDLIF